MVYDDWDIEGPEIDSTPITEAPDENINAIRSRVIEEVESTLDEAIKKIDYDVLIYPIVMEWVQQRLYGDYLCVRTLITRVCPLEWSLKVDGVDVKDSNIVMEQYSRSEAEYICYPPEHYNGLCGSLNMTTLADRLNMRSREKLLRWAMICQAEWPCSPAPIVDMTKCPANYKEIEKDKKIYCLRRGESGLCSPVLSLDFSSESLVDKAAWSYRCLEPFPTTDSTESLVIKGIPPPVPKNKKLDERLVDGYGPIEPLSGVVYLRTETN